MPVSDTASLDAAADKSGPAIRSILDGRTGFSCPHHLIVPDEVSAIQDAVMKCIKRGDVDWIITTGGTGFGVRDLTPEVGLALRFSLSKLKSYISRPFSHYSSARLLALFICSFHHRSSTLHLQRFRDPLLGLSSKHL